MFPRPNFKYNGRNINNVVIAYDPTEYVAYQGMSLPCYSLY